MATMAPVLPALNIASALNGYALTDRGTWLAFGNRGALSILVEGDRRLINPYSVMVVNPARHPHVFDLVEFSRACRLGYLR